MSGVWSFVGSFVCLFYKKFKNIKFHTSEVWWIDLQRCECHWWMALEVSEDMWRCFTLSLGYLCGGGVKHRSHRLNAMLNYQNIKHLLGLNLKLLIVEPERCIYIVRSIVFPIVMANGIVYCNWLIMTNLYYTENNYYVFCLDWVTQL